MHIPIAGCLMVLAATAGCSRKEACGGTQDRLKSLKANALSWTLDERLRNLVTQREELSGVEDPGMTCAACHTDRL